MDTDIPEQENPEIKHDEYVLGPNDLEPVVINPFHFVLLFFATMGVYSVWWQYKCWKYFKEKEKADTLPALRAILFIFFGIELLNKIAYYCREYDHKVKYNSVATWSVIIIFKLLSGLPEPYLWVSLLEVIPTLLPVRELNFYFTGNKNGYVNDKLNDRQIMLLVLGSILWVLVIFSIVMGGPSVTNH